MTHTPPRQPSHEEMETRGQGSQESWLDKTSLQPWGRQVRDGFSRDVTPVFPRRDWGGGEGTSLRAWSRRLAPMPRAQRRTLGPGTQVLSLCDPGWAPRRHTQAALLPGDTETPNVTAAVTHDARRAWSWWDQAGTEGPQASGLGLPKQTPQRLPKAPASPPWAGSTCTAAGPAGDQFRAWDTPIPTTS